jgi:hypothetical protein
MEKMGSVYRMLFSKPEGIIWEIRAQIGGNIKMFWKE